MAGRAKRLKDQPQEKTEGAKMYEDLMQRLKIDPKKTIEEIRALQAKTRESEKVRVVRLLAGIAGAFLEEYGVETAVFAAEIDELRKLQKEMRKLRY